MIFVNILLDFSDLLFVWSIHIQKQDQKAILQFFLQITRFKLNTFFQSENIFQCSFCAKRIGIRKRQQANCFVLVFNEGVWRIYCFHDLTFVNIEFNYCQSCYPRTENFNECFWCLSSRFILQWVSIL